MSQFHPDDSHNELNRFMRSLELWPDPFDSPEVPDENILQAFKDGNVSDIDLREQIKESIDCQRAMALLERKSGSGKSADVMALRSALIELSRKHPVPSASRFQQEPPSGKTEADLLPQIGALFATSPKIEQWNGREWVHRYTFRPLDVLILDEGHSVPWGDTIFRCVACSPADLWPTELRADDESLADFGQLGGFVIHWWLNYPVSRSQLTRKISQLSRKNSTEPILPQQFPSAGPEPDPDDKALWLERDQLHACAAYLGANAHARRIAAEEGGSLSPKTVAAIILLFSVFQQRARAAAASGKVVCPLAVIPKDQLEAAGYHVQEEAKSPSPDGDATVVVGPLRDQDRAYMEWTLYPPQKEGTQVLVFNLREKRLLGEARLSSDGSTAILSDVQWENFKVYAENPDKLHELGVAVIKDVR